MNFFKLIFLIDFFNRFLKLTKKKTANQSNSLKKITIFIFKIIQSTYYRGYKLKILDLSHTLEDKMPVFPQDPDFSIDEILNSEKDGVTLSLIKMGLHAGTHIDSPYHFYSEGKKINEIELDTLIGPIKLIDATNNLSNSINSSENLSKDNLNPLNGNSKREIDVSLFKNVEKGDIVIIKTGWSKNWGLSNYFTQNPYLSDESAEFLIKKQIIGLGIDSPSVDTLEETSVHEKLLHNDIWIIENLKNLELVPQCPDENLEFFCIPLPLKCEASPVRAFIRLNNNEN